MKEQDMDMEYDFIKIEEGEESEQVSTQLVANTKRSMIARKPTRSQEEYESFIESKYTEVHYMSDGTPYDVTVTVLKPEVNDLEGLKQCYAYQTRS
ncbi:hypothetical protein DIDNDMLP_00353 [Klebsiella phage KP13-7]|nr:hypothetical protein DIDNDMLP_00353 [Klebsiella phage KP13-7]